MTEQNYGEYGRCEATAKSTGERCKKAAIGPHGKCDTHGGKSLKGTDHPNFEHGRTSKYFKSKLSDRQREVYDEMAAALDEPEDAVKILSQVATQMILRGVSMNDPSMIREGRQILSEFNVVPNEDQIEMNAQVDVDATHELTDQEREHLDQLTGMGGDSS